MNGMRLSFCIVHRCDSVGPQHRDMVHGVHYEQMEVIGGPLLLDEQSVAIWRIMINVALMFGK